MIEARADARAGLIGNPSDGYFGKTISFIIKNFCARVWCAESDRLEVIPGKRDPVNFSSLADLAADVDLHGYYGGLRLLKATLKRFHDYCQEQGLEIPALKAPGHGRAWFVSASVGGAHMSPDVRLGGARLFFEGVPVGVAFWEILMSVVEEFCSLQ